MASNVESRFESPRLVATAKPLSPDDVERINAYWRAANYLSVGQIYLLDNPSLREPLQPHHIKPRLLGHWGTTPDCFHLAGDVVDRVPMLQPTGGHFKQVLRNKLIDHKLYIVRYGDDMPEVRDWKWPY
jgi:phosphoketolase